MSRRATGPSPRAHGDHIRSLEQRYRASFAAGDFVGALEHIRAARRSTPSPEVAANEVYCLAKLRRFADAAEIGRTLPAERLGFAFMDLMCTISGELGQTANVRRFGSESLRLKALSVADGRRFPLPPGRPPALDATAPTRNVIAFSLFGGSPRYCEGAVMNCAAAARLLPGWTCRFYVDDSVPASVRDRIVKARGEIVVVPTDVRRRIHPLMWRFLVVDDVSVDRFLLRDADSLIGERERDLVAAWLASDKWFHLARDWFTHSELILAGLWGGCQGILPSIDEAMTAFLAAGRYTPTHLDQEFLRSCVWPTMSQSLLSHDNRFDFAGNVPFPQAEDPYLHIGANMSATSLGAPTAAPDGTTLRWTLRDEHRIEVCSYVVRVNGGAWRDHIPDPYCRRIELGEWSVTTAVVAHP